MSLTYAQTLIGTSFYKLLGITPSSKLPEPIKSGGYWKKEDTGDEVLRPNFNMFFAKNKAWQE